MSFRIFLVALVLQSSSFLFGTCKSFVIHQQEKIWNYKGHPIGYEVATTNLAADSTSTNKDNNNQKEPILLLNGFGVGSFHQHRLIQRLLEQEQDHEQQRTIYGIDYLGQGRSWPKECNDGQSENEQGLIYSGDTWVDQVIQFIEQVILPAEQESSTKNINKKIHLVGNSLGGHLAAYIAAKRPDLIESISLLNATPVWGLNLPGWSGALPPPGFARFVGRYLFDRVRDLNTIRRFLDNSYYHRNAYDEDLVHQIRACTEGNGGHAAFASILWSPPVDNNKNNQHSTTISDNNTLKKSFYDYLADVECDVLIVFGKDDPWCKPAFAKKMLQALDQRHPEKVHRYVELSNVGHCPNHEAPQAVAKLLSAWADAKTSMDNNKEQQSQRRTVPLVQGTQEVISEQWGDILVQERDANDIPLSWMDRLATSFVG